MQRFVEAPLVGLLSSASCDSGLFVSFQVSACLQKLSALVFFPCFFRSSVMLPLYVLCEAF